jgi:hypothetical protein
VYDCPPSDDAECLPEIPGAKPDISTRLPSNISDLTFRIAVFVRSRRDLVPHRIDLGDQSLRPVGTMAHERDSEQGVHASASDVNATFRQTPGCGD